MTMNRLGNRQNSEIIIKKNIIRKKAGLIYKRGDGPFDYNWNERYLVLDCETLMYFKSHEDKTPRGFIRLLNCEISNIERMDDREYCFSVESFNPPKKYYFSCDNEYET